MKKPETVSHVCHRHALTADAILAGLVASGEVDFETLHRVAEWTKTQMLSGDPAARALINDQVKYLSLADR